MRKFSSAEGAGYEHVLLRAERQQMSSQHVHAKSTQQTASATSSPAKKELLGFRSLRCVSGRWANMDLPRSLELSWEAVTHFLLMGLLSFLLEEV